jgi:hypothetical protein
MERRQFEGGDLQMYNEISVMKNDANQEYSRGDWREWIRWDGSEARA